MNKKAKHLLALGKMYWPQYDFYDKQREIIESVVENDETVVVAGNELGKDFVAGFIIPSFFLWPQFYFDDEYVKQVQQRCLPGTNSLHIHTRRIVTTSVRQKHQDVLWGEIGRYLSSAQELVPGAEALLDSKEQHGRLTVNAFELRFTEEREVKKPYNYVVGIVSEKGEGLAGHHAAYTLAVIDEASGVDDNAYKFMQGWAKKFLIFGNPHPCVNFFYKGVKQGNIKKGA